jgi:hypothetical protein
MIVTDGKTAGDGLAKPTEVLPHALPDRLQRLKAGGSSIGMDPNTFSGAVINGHEHRRLTLAGVPSRRWWK